LLRCTGYRQHAFAACVSPVARRCVGGARAPGRTRRPAPGRAARTPCAHSSALRAACAGRGVAADGDGAPRREGRDSVPLADPPRRTVPAARGGRPKLTRQRTVAARIGASSHTMSHKAWAAERSAAIRICPGVEAQGDWCSLAWARLTATVRVQPTPRGEPLRPWPLLNAVRGRVVKAAPCGERAAARGTPTAPGWLSSGWGRIAARRAYGGRTDNLWSPDAPRPRPSPS
jgi:hypothetical protein